VCFVCLILQQPLPRNLPIGNKKVMRARSRASVAVILQRCTSARLIQCTLRRFFTCAFGNRPGLIPCSCGRHLWSETRQCTVYRYDTPGVSCVGRIHIKCTVGVWYLAEVCLIVDRGTESLPARLLRRVGIATSLLSLSPCYIR